MVRVSACGQLAPLYRVANHAKNALWRGDYGLQRHRLATAVAGAVALASELPRSAANNVTLSETE